MRLNRWEDALAAFSRVVQQDPEQNDAWGNIAAIHMKLKNAASAYAALKEALRGAHENWRAWENLLTVRGRVAARPIQRGAERDLWSAMSLDRFVARVRVLPPVSHAAAAWSIGGKLMWRAATRSPPLRFRNASGWILADRPSVVVVVVA